MSSSSSSSEDFDFFDDALQEVVEAQAKVGLTDDRRHEIAGGVMQWLAGRTKVTGPETDQRLAQFEKRVKQMMLGIEVLTRPDGQPVLRTRGSDEETLKLLRLGTRWFYGSEEVIDLILGGVFNSNPA